MSVNKYNGTNLIRVAGKGKKGDKGDTPDVMIGATSTTDGAIGSVPQPMAGDEDKVLKGNGSWASAAADDNFVGTLAEWNALTLAEQIKYKTADITDDFNGSPIDSALSDTSSNPVQNKVITEEFGNIGTMLFVNQNAEGLTYVNVPDDTVTIACSVELTKGTWLVIGYADWAPNTNGYRQIQFVDSSTINPARDKALTSVPSSLNTKEHFMQMTYMVNIQSTETISLYVRQTSGGDLTVYQAIRAIRIR